MSIHKSLAIKSALKRHRNVLKRHERLAILRKKGTVTKDSSVFNLPKTKTAKKIKKTKKKEEAAS